MPLPVVKPETGGPINKDLLIKGDKKFIGEIMEKLENQNPCIGELILGLAQASKDPTLVLMAGVLVYKFLESQQEADEMNQKY